MSPHTPLRHLSEILSDAIGKLEEHCAAAGLPYPSLNEPFNPTNPSEALTVDPAVLKHAMIAIAAADQIIATVRLPPLSVLDLSLGFHISSALQAVTVGNIPEILREGRAQGVHAVDIAAKNGMNADKVSRLLRLLATHHVFREVEPNVWTNNRLSSMLDTMKPSLEILSSPSGKHIGTPGLAALIEHSTDEVFKSSVALTEVLRDPKTAHSDEPTDSPWNRAYNTDTSFFQWMGAPGNESRWTRFNMAMEGVSKLDDGEAMLRGFPWDTLPNGAKVVDVGGGFGSASLTVAKHFPDLKLTIQDLPAVVGEGAKFWEQNLPDAYKSGRVVLQPHDFFTPQPIKDADVFLLRAIAHDWPTTYVIKILKQLRAAAVPGKTKLLLVDQIASYACPDTSQAGNIPGAALPPVPEPLLSNLGKANSIVYLADLQMLTVQQGQERTLGNHMYVMREAGWSLGHMYSPAGSILHHLVAEAV